MLEKKQQLADALYEFFLYLVIKKNNFFHISF